MSPHVPESEAARTRAVKRRIWNRPQTFRASCALGLEQLLADEVAALPDVAEIQVVPGAVRFVGPFDTVYAALLRLRTADTVRVLIGDEAAASFAMARDHLARLRWSLWLPARCRLDVRVRSRGSRLRDDEGLERTLRQAVRDHGVDDRAGEGAPGLQVRLELRDDRAFVWLDAGGDPLHLRRGDRWSSPTTLRETTAAAVCLAGLPRDADLVLDPFCGSGTLIEEGAAWLDGRCVGSDRAFALEASPAWRPARMRNARRLYCPAEPAAEPAAESAQVATRFVASDADEEAVRAARHNLEAAGLASRSEVRRTDARELSLSALAERHGARRPVLLSNPPYGRRAPSLGADPDALLSTVLAGASGWSFALLYPDPNVIAAIEGVQVDTMIPVRMRGLKTAIVVGTVLAGASESSMAAGSGG
ncbi:MAG: hypothetical protein U5J97_00445 [Trueperaceae bacterium]|nr:hypothetical protein [Trueperaceae bacterium]